MGLLGMWVVGRLEEQYGAGDEEEGDGEEEGEKQQKKPEEWHLFFHGNCDDAFKLGLSLTPGQVGDRSPAARLTANQSWSSSSTAEAAALVPPRAGC